MSFEWPLLLWGLGLIPIAAAAHLLWNRGRTQRARRFVSSGLSGNVVVRKPAWRRHVPPAVYILALCAAVLGLARPQAAIGVPRERATVLLVIDTSSSMRAGDVAPSRLEAAIDSVRLLLRELPDRYPVGLVGFSNRAKILSVPTSDRVAVTRALESIELEQGTAIGDGLMRARDLATAPRRRVPTVAILLSDGNNTTGQTDPLEAARVLRRARIVVHSVVVGRPHRTPRTGPRPSNDALLKDVAETTGGRFFAAASGGDLDAAYRDLGSRISTVRQQTEITAAFVGAAALLLLCGAGLSLLWFNRLP
jgi:Ca-activated chloride channel family protein